MRLQRSGRGYARLRRSGRYATDAPQAVVTLSQPEAEAMEEAPAPTMNDGAAAVLLKKLKR